MLIAILLVGLGSNAIAFAEPPDEIAYFEESGILAAGLRIAHGVWLDQGHLTRVQGHDFSVVHCPSANLKLHFLRP